MGEATVSGGVEIMNDIDLRQMACLAQHKRHWVWRTGKNFSECCQWCGVSWMSRQLVGELVRVYPHRTSKKCDFVIQGSDDATQYTAIPLEIS